MVVPIVNLRTVQRKSGTKYMLDYTIRGKRIRETVGANKRNAQQKQAKVQEELRLGTLEIKPSTSSSKDLDSLIEEFLISKENLIRGSSLHRYKNYFNAVRHFIYTNFPSASEDISQIKGYYIKACMDELLKREVPWAAKTINGMRQIISSLFKFAIKKEYLSRNPTVDTKDFPIPEKGKVKYFTDQELDLIWKTIDPFWVDHLKFILYTGLRKGEMINLKWVNVTLEHYTPNITITSSDDWKTKSGKSRMVPLNKTALKIINDQKNKHPEFVFTDKKGRKIHPDRPYRALQSALTELNLTGDVHQLRHTFSAKLAMAGKNIYDIKELLGHVDIATTQIYAHLSPEHLKNTVEVLDDL